MCFPAIRQRPHEAVRAAGVVPRVCIYEAQAHRSRDLMVCTDTRASGGTILVLVHALYAPICTAAESVEFPQGMPSFVLRSLVLFSTAVKGATTTEHPTK